MPENSKHPPYCRKEKEIAEIHTDLRNIKRIVMEGNGEEALATSVPKLAQSVDTLAANVVGLKTGVRSFLKFQENLEGQREGKAEVRRRNRWIIGTLVSILAAMFGTLVFLIDKLSNSTP